MQLQRTLADCILHLMPRAGIDSIISLQMLFGRTDEEKIGEKKNFLGSRSRGPRVISSRQTMASVAAVKQKKRKKESSTRPPRIHRGRNRASGDRYRDSISYSSVDRRRVVTSIRARLRLFYIHTHTLAAACTHSRTRAHAERHSPRRADAARLFYWQFQKLRPRRVNRLFSSPCSSMPRRNIQSVNSHISSLFLFYISIFFYGLFTLAFRSLSIFRSA